ncbi:MAG TPA: diguanylate cyclase [Solirubrobacteraceae bacterium]|nr:diguanylate cyclase [Solirubrobacteraceae bacterium]
MDIGSSSIRISTHFFIALAVLLVSFVAVASLGLVGLRDVQRANDQVFSDNLLTVEATSQLAVDLGEAERIALELTSVERATEVAVLKAQLEQIQVPRVNADIKRFLALHADDPRSEYLSLQRIPSQWKAIALTPGGPLRNAGRSSAVVQRVRAADAIADTMDPLILFVSGRRSIERQAAASAHARAEASYHSDQKWLIAATAIAFLAALSMLFVGAALKRMVDHRTRDELFEAAESEYLDALQLTENEHEAQELLRGQVERSLRDAKAVVLIRNNSADRLEARTVLTDLDPLSSSLVGATPRTCLAVRSGHSHVESPERDTLVQCEICSQLPAASTCEPLLVSGEVIGVVLISHAGELEPGPRQRVRETVAQAAPVLANLRNLAIAQRQAATDALTGLPNRRAADDNLKRMVAQSARTGAPLAVLLMDLDNFKNINDVYGHDRGDEVLAAVGTALRDTLRESDFAGRYGGEEFLLLLAGADKQAALQVAEKVRVAVAAVRIPNSDQITASIGVAALPDDAGDALTLVRLADRALYTAKNNGRNRVETITCEDRSRPTMAAQAD